MRIEFYHIDAMEAVHYEPIWRELVRNGVDARMVAVPGQKNTASNGWFDFDTLASYYSNRQIPFFTEVDPSANAITTQNSYILREYRGLRIRLMYGPSVYPGAWGVSRQAAKGFDVILVHGRRYVEELSSWTSRDQLRIAGYPRYDEFFSGKGELQELHSRQRSDGIRKLLYLPTWGQNSSFDLFFESIVALAGEFELLVKPHHCTVRFEPDRMERILSSAAECVQPSSALASLLVASDVIVADARSAALCEALLLARPCVAVLPAPGDAAWAEQVQLPELVTVCGNPAGIADAVADAENSDPFSPARCSWREESVSFLDGSAAARAAAEIVAAINEKSSTAGKALRSLRPLVGKAAAWLSSC